MEEIVRYRRILVEIALLEDGRHGCVLALSLHVITIIMITIIIIAVVAIIIVIIIIIVDVIIVVSM